MVPEHSYPSCRCRFECQWVSGVPDGEATVAFANGDRYEGNYVAYTRRGQGTMLYADGSKCVSYGHRLPLSQFPLRESSRGRPCGLRHTGASLALCRIVGVVCPLSREILLCT